VGRSQGLGNRVGNRAILGQPGENRRTLPRASALTTDPTHVTLEKAIGAYLAEAGAYGSANTMKNYRRVMKKLTAFGVTCCWTSLGRTIFGNSAPRGPSAPRPGPGI
jgi:hypothetical protein